MNVIPRFSFFFKFRADLCNISQCCDISIFKKTDQNLQSIRICQPSFEKFEFSLKIPKNPYFTPDFPKSLDSK